MSRITGTMPEAEIEIDICTREMEDLIAGCLDNTDFASHIDTCLETHDFDQVVDETLERHNFGEYKNAVDATQRKCEILRVDQEHIITALGAIRGTLDYMLASIRPLNAHEIRAQRVQALMLKMNESDAQSCLEYCKAALEMTRIDNQ